MHTKEHSKMHFPAVLRPHNIKLKTFRERNKQYTDLAVASFVFYPPESHIKHRPALGFMMTEKGFSHAPFNAPIEPAELLLLERKVTDIVLPDLYEVPWAVSALTDRTILYSVQRVVFERTGLHLKRFVKQIGNREDYKSSEGLCARLNFEVEVSKEVDELSARPPVKLNKDTHQDFVWVKEKDITNDTFLLAIPEQKDVILQAFQL